MDNADLAAQQAVIIARFPGRMIERQRVDVLTGVHWLWEWAGLADDAELGPQMLARWVGAD